MSIATPTTGPALHEGPVRFEDAPRVLVGIASYGTAQDHFLKRLIEEYRRIPLPVDIVVLTNAPKPVEGAEVVVGLPSKDPYSLPFAHKELFAARADRYDLFIYSEDDTLITERHIRAFLDAQAKLGEDEIPGFIRSESDPEGRRYIVSVNTMFRWIPGSVVERGGENFATFSNEHSGCFLVTRRQLKKAIASGGFLVPPHAERYQILETAASDLYTQCGLRRLVSLSRIEDFIVPHLANKYYHRMGIPLEELKLQVAALRRISEEGGWTGTLYDPDSGLRGLRCCKNLYERTEEPVLRAVPAAARRVLSLGCGWGENEERLEKRGHTVCAVPVDAVLAASVARRGIRTVVGPLDQAMKQLEGEQFDAVLLADALHLVADPVEWLRAAARRLAPGGRVIVSVPNTTELTGRVRDLLAGHKRAGRAAHRVSRARLKQWIRQAGLEIEGMELGVEPTRNQRRRWAVAKLGSRFAPHFLAVARRPEARA